MKPEVADRAEHKDPAGRVSVGAQRPRAGVGMQGGSHRRGDKLGLQWQTRAGGTLMGLMRGCRNLLGPAGARRLRPQAVLVLPAWWPSRGGAQSAWRENEASQTLSWVGRLLWESFTCFPYIYPVLPPFPEVPARLLCCVLKNF